MSDSPYRALPGVDLLLQTSPLKECEVGHLAKGEAARQVISEARAKIAEGGVAPKLGELAQHAVAHLDQWTAPNLRRVINATGVMIHTNLGRAPLSAEAVSAALGACNLEFDLHDGVRGSRRSLVEDRLCQLSGAEAALVVNNCAAAVFLALAAIARGGEVIISRGELVEIGGSFRVPEILEASGATLREVGTTNKTYTRDYEAAYTPLTRALMRVHPSNFVVQGFTHMPKLAELAALARSLEVPLISDLGSGSFVPLPSALSDRVSPADELEAGVDLVCFSGDKLLGGPQCGIILGRRDLVNRLARHPLARAVRVDKLTLGVLDYTLTAYRTGQPERIRVWEMLHQTEAAMRSQAERLADGLRDLSVELAITECQDPIGGGSHPGEVLPGYAIALTSQGTSLTEAAQRMRRRELPVIAVVRDEHLLLHVRTLREEDIAEVISAVKEAFSASN